MNALCLNSVAIIYYFLLIFLPAIFLLCSQKKKKKLFLDPHFPNVLVSIIIVLLLLQMLDDYRLYLPSFQNKNKENTARLINNFSPPKKAKRKQSMGTCTSLALSVYL